MASAFKWRSAGYGINEGVHAQPGQSHMKTLFFPKKNKGRRKKTNRQRIVGDERRDGPLFTAAANPQMRDFDE